MGGGLMQLVAVGVQDTHLTGNPEISFYKVVYRRHTNFSMESIEQSFDGNAKPGSRITCTIARNGDLLTNLWLYVKVTNNALLDQQDYTNSLGHAIIEYAELEIGGQRIDKHYGEWLDIWSELTVPAEKRDGFDEMIGKKMNFPYNLHLMYGSNTNPILLTIPLQFFFCRHPGLALPLIALQYHEVKVNIKFRESHAIHRNFFGPKNQITSFEDVTLYANYVYLDTEERKRFAKMTHEYLIDQVQHTGPKSTISDKVSLEFNHPVKELVWVIRKKGHFVFDYGNVSGSEYTHNVFNLDSNKENEAEEPFTSGVLQVNGHDRFQERDASYFRLVQPYEHHTRVPWKHIFCYSFALYPEAHQPSGSCNFSRLDNVYLNLKGMASKTNGEGDLLVYAVSNNILRITSGMGGLAYSN
jgi:hypothetical protein